MTEKDPVCGMSVSADSENHSEYEGQTYRFCSAACLQKFEAAPRNYLPAEVEHEHACCDDRHHGHSAESTTKAKTLNAAAVYTCPMHPEVRQQGPGSCPKCGMALEPMGAPVPSTKIE